MQDRLFICILGFVSEGVSTLRCWVHSAPIFFLTTEWLALFPGMRLLRWHPINLQTGMWPIGLACDLHFKTKVQVLMNTFIVLATTESVVWDHPWFSFDCSSWSDYGSRHQARLVLSSHTSRLSHCVDVLFKVAVTQRWVVVLATDVPTLFLVLGLSADGWKWYC